MDSGADGQNSADSSDLRVCHDISVESCSMSRTVAIRNPRVTCCRHRLEILLVAMVISLADGSIQSVFAQQSTPSHRVLGNGLPAFEGNASQVELLQRLQMLSGAAQAKGNDLLNSKQADPQTLDSLQRAMQQLQGMNSLTPDGNLPNLPEPEQQSHDDSTTSGAGRDGQRGFGQSRDGQRGNGLNDIGIDREFDGTQTRPGSRSPDEPTEENVDRSALQRIAEQMGLSLEPTRQPSADAGRNRPNGGLPKTGELQPGQPEPPAAQRPGEPRSPGTPPRTPGRSERLNTEGLSAPSEELNAPNRLPGAAEQSGNPSRSSSGRNSSKSADGQASPGSSANSSDGTSVVPSEPRHPAGTGQGDSPDGTGNGAIPAGQPTESPGNDDDAAGAAESESAEDRLKAQRNDRLDDLRDSPKSLRQKLIDIAKLARSESGQTQSSTGERTAERSDGLQAVFTDMLAEATKELTEHVDDLVTRERVARSERGHWRSERRDERGGSLGRIGRLGNRATEWLADTVEPETRPVTESDGGLSGSGLTDSTSPVLVFLILLIGGGVVFWFLQRNADAGLMTDRDAVRSTAPPTLNNRQDVVQAFHDLAARCPTLIADWWTHDRAATALAVTRPDMTDDVRQLAQLYEQARYLPDGLALSDEQLAAAKAAWLRCRKP